MKTRICLNNIYTLCEKRGVKVKDIEAEAKVSTGYLSRAKNDTEPKLSLAIVIAASKLLHVSIDVLCSYDFDKLTPSEVYVANLICVLTKNLNDKVAIDWIVHSQPELIHAEQIYDQGIFYSPHPLFDVKDKDTLIYNSKYHPNGRDLGDLGYAESWLEGDAFSLKMPGISNELWLFKVGYGPCPDDETPLDEGYEMYMISGGNAVPLCAGSIASSNRDKFYKSLEVLYQTLVDKTGAVRIDGVTKDILDVFLSGKDLPLKDEDFPF